MSKVLEQIERNQDRSKRLIGLDYNDFIELYNKLEAEHQKREAIKEANKIRINAKGGGKKRKLSNMSEIVLALYYMRHHITFENLGLLFDLSESKANSTFHYWSTLMDEILVPSLIEQVEVNEGDYAYVKELLLEFELLIDGTDQKRERPMDKGEQEKYYSGYKHQHAFRNVFICLPMAKDIVGAFIGYPGPTAEINIFRENKDKFHDQQTFRGDLGFQGEAQIAVPPHKKPKNGKLSVQQNQENKEFSSKRIFVEHLIRLIKIFRIAQERFRLHARHYERSIRIVCGLVRLRIGALVLG